MRNQSPQPEVLDEQALTILGLVLAGEASPAEKSRVEGWSQEDSARGETLRELLEGQPKWEEHEMSNITASLPPELSPEVVLPRLISRLERARALVFVLLLLATVTSLIAVLSGDTPRSPIGLVVSLSALWLAGPWVIRFAITKVEERTIAASCDPVKWNRFIDAHGNELQDEPLAKSLLAQIPMMLLAWILFASTLVLMRFFSGTTDTLSQAMKTLDLGDVLFVSLASLVFTFVRRR